MTFATLLVGLRLAALVAMNMSAADQPPVDGIVAVVLSNASESNRETAAGFRRRLEQRGGRIALEVNLGVGDERRSVESLRSLDANVIFAVGDYAVEVVHRARGNASVVSTLVSTLVPSLDAHGSGGDTGVLLEFPIEQQLTWLRRLLPAGTRRLGIVYGPGENARAMDRIRQAAKELELEIVSRPVTKPSEIPQALSGLTGRADVLWGVPDDVVMTPETARSILLFSMRNRLPLIGLSSAWVRAGALLSLDRDYADMGAQCADQVLRRLQGEPIAAIRPEFPRLLRYSLNTRTAEQMKIVFSPETIRNASEVVR